MRALWIGPGAQRALTAAALGTLEIALRRGGYVNLGGRWLLLAPARAPLGPLSVLVAGLGPLEAGAPVHATAGALCVGALRIDLDGARVPAPAPAQPLAASWRAALGAARRTCPALCGLETGVAALRRGALAEAAASLAGRGPGLTPAGDDVLAGFAGWRHAEGAPVSLTALAARRGSPIGLAYLRCAERGELPEPARRTLDAVRAGDPALAARRARVLARWGATSGGAMLCGMAAAAEPA
jgi:hypothetical protein